MSRDFKFLRRNSSMNEEIEKVPVNPKDSSGSQSTFTDSSSRPPLNTLNPKIEQEALTRARIDRTPTKPVKPKNSDHTLPLRTPDKHGVSYLSKHRFGWANKNESRSNSTQSTPMKSVSKPPNSGFRSKFDWNGNGNVRAGNLAALYKGIPSSGGQATVVNIVEVPHFDLKEDPSFWMDHSVQVLLRVRPLNSMEKSTQGYTRCLKQESAQSITWIGQPETRFTFDHVACETVDQEMIFRMAGLQMVENCLSGYNSCMFAYGQAGSGKTHTMLGEIEDLEVRPSPHRGMTPRIFEFLFARIQAEEESRRDEKLKYNCKCSFLEIYNEQITDLIDPSSNNLMLREDVKKGVYVENLSEFEVQTVGDILKLLTQGSLNRKVAATNMNRESSRSHSVFTCVIESRWEKDSTTNLRFARLNLVDLAGSERQKTSGAEGERLKEAASINKSLSTLSHVIMILVDLTHGKPKHVPYRDSRLTFLLQDSLGGNSKTMIIANVSPSICCAADTLSTLKFAQRAKLIQNNAVVNEDSTGDVNALQHQIRLLKEELLLLIEAHQQECNEKEQEIILLLSELRGKTSTIAEMIKLHGEKEEMLVSKKQNEQGMKCLVTQLLTLQATVDNFEKQSELKMEAVNRKLGEFEQIVHEAGTDWCQMKEILEHEVGDAKIIAVQKTAEASCIFAKLEEAQDTMKEADIMINGLLIANEKMKLDKEKLKQTQVKLKKSLQSINYLKDQQLGHELLAIIEEMGISVKTNLKYITAEEKERTIAAARLFRPKNPSFMVIMRPRDLCSGALYVPVGFAKEYLISRDAELIKLQDRDGREWSVNFRKACVGGGGGYFICGWPKFLKDKNLKEGDICIFELIKEENIVLKVSVFDSSTSFSKSNSSLVIRTL